MMLHKKLKGPDTALYERGESGQKGMGAISL